MLRRIEHPFWWGFGITVLGALAVVGFLNYLSPNFLKEFSNANQLEPHGYCLLWQPELIWLHISSDSLIGASYVSISTTLAYLAYRTYKNIPFNWIIVAFGVFIIACGATHFIEVWTLWSPVYWLSGGVKAITALASIVTAIALFRLTPQILKIVRLARSAEERRVKLQTTNEELETEIAERKLVEEALRESEERYRRLIELSPDMISVSSGGKFVYVNEAGLKLLGASKAEQVIGTGYFEAKEPEFIQKSSQPEGTEENNRIYLTKTEVVGLDGRTTTIEATSVPITYQGQPASLAIIRDITERRQIEARVKASLQEKEILLKEIHHRVKNNLQIVSSLLKLQAARVQDTSTLALLTESQHRVKSMALIHEKLYQSEELAWIDFAAYIRSLTTSLFRTYRINSATELKFNLKVENIQLNIDTAIPCGLIINELVTNCLKYAFPDSAQPAIVERESYEVSIEFGYLDGKAEQYFLAVKDNGVGFPAEAVDLEKAQSLGLRLVNTLVKQLDGQITVDSKAGCGSEIKITFSKN